MYGQKEKESVKKEPHDDLSNVVRLQIHSCELIHTISITGKSYQVFLGNDVQLQDAELFCCDSNGVLAVDTTFNLCGSWFTDTCYYNKRLVNSDGHNPVFLGPTLIHFIKDQKSPKIRNLHTIGTDHEMAISNGFSPVLPNLNLFLRIHRLDQGDKQKISNLVLQKGAKQAIIATTVSTVVGTLEFKNMVWQILQIMTTFMQN